MDVSSTQSSQLNRLFDELAREMASGVGAASGQSRDFGTDVATTANAGSQSQMDQEGQRIFGALISQFVPPIASGILGLFRQRRRDLGIPEQRDSNSDEQDLRMVLPPLLQNILSVIPGIVKELSGKPAPRGAEEEAQRFFPLLVPVLSAAISAAPGIIAAFNRQRGAEGSEPSVTDPEVADRFIGPLLSKVVPTLLKSAGPILQSIFRGDSGSRGAGSSSSTW
jgi:hypothetical protein